MASIDPRIGPRPSRQILVMLLIGLTSGCAGTMEIGSILDDPSEYDGESVRVEGEVTESLGLPVLGGGYRIDDGTGELTVVSGRGAPREGAEVRVEGIFHSVFTIGDRSLSVIEEEDRDVR